jgi:regulator of protease activity HflC (stomatin/prohibitin superfamily)
MGIIDALNDLSLIVLTLAAVYVLLRFYMAIQIVPNRKAYIVERLGRYHSTLGPGFHVLLPFLDKLAFKQDLKERAIVEEPQVCFTHDNVRVKVDGVIYLSVADPVKASYGITDFEYASVQLAQTTTRSVIGQIDLDRTFEEREKISAKVVEVLGEAAQNWGIVVHRYEVKNITPPQSVQDSMEKQLTAERERRAMIARAEGHRQAKINESEGTKQELINKSLGEKQKRINEAQGRANEITSIASATADSIRKIAAAIRESHGQEAVQMRVSQKYLGELDALADSSTQVVLPVDLNNMQAILSGVDLT